MLDTLTSLLAAGAYWPALAALLILATHAIRRAGADRLLDRLIGDVGRWLRPWIPIGLAAVAFAVAWLSGAVELAEAAAQSLAAAVTAIAGHDTGQALLALARVLLGPTAGAHQDDAQPRDPGRDMPPGTGPRNRMQRVARARSIVTGPMLALLLPLSLGAVIHTAGCVRPQSRPMPAVMPAPGSPLSLAATETLAECRRLRDRSMLATATSAADGALAGGLGAIAIPADRDRVQISLGVASAMTAALGAGLALLGVRYNSALDDHCSSWPRPGAVTTNQQERHLVLHREDPRQTNPDRGKPRDRRGEQAAAAAAAPDLSRGTK